MIPRCARDELGNPRCARDKLRKNMRRIFIALLLATPLFAATRLPQNVIPDHYTIAIAPDLASETFSGEETIDVEVKEPVDTITLHSIDLNLKDVRVGAVVPQLTFDAPNETVTLTASPTGHVDGAETKIGT